VLETVAAVPGMVGATLTHLRCLRNICDDKGWIAAVALCPVHADTIRMPA
jgi:hypothetical protein